MKYRCCSLTFRIYIKTIFFFGLVIVVGLRITVASLECLLWRKRDMKNLPKGLSADQKRILRKKPSKID